MDNEFLIELQAKLDEAKSKGLINKDLLIIEESLSKLKIQAEIDPNSVKRIASQLSNILNQKITVDNIQINANQAVKNAQQTGKQIGSTINQELQSGLYDLKQKIDIIFKELNSQKLSTVNLSKMFNLDRKDLDSSIKDKVRGLTKELNALAKEAIKTSSDTSWKNLLSNLNQLHNILNKFGMERDIKPFQESIDILEYFQKSLNGTSIFVGGKEDGLANTD